MCLECLKRPFQIITCDRPGHLKGFRTEAQLFCKVKYFDDNKFFFPSFLPSVGNIVFIAQSVDNPSSYTFFFSGMAIINVFFHLALALLGT